MLSSSAVDFSNIRPLLQSSPQSYVTARLLSDTLSSQFPICRRVCLGDQLLCLLWTMLLSIKLNFSPSCPDVMTHSSDSSSRRSGFTCLPGVWRGNDHSVKNISISEISHNCWHQKYSRQDIQIYEFKKKTNSKLKNTSGSKKCLWLPIKDCFQIQIPSGCSKMYSLGATGLVDLWKQQIQT